MLHEDPGINPGIITSAALCALLRETLCTAPPKINRGQFYNFDGN